MYSYIVKTPFEQMMCDWNEYRNMRKRYKLLRRERDFRQKQISEKYGDTDIKCICKVGTGAQVLLKPVYSVNYCEEFFKGNCDGRCSRGFQHDRYWQMYNELKVVQTGLAEFWNKKFQNIK
jgi:hypothetical protein